MNKTLVILGTITLLFSCGNTKKTNEQILWVNSFKTACEGVASMNCLQIQEGDTVSHENWKLFYNRINGFDYRPGKIYKLKVMVDSLEAATVPADASTLKYTLVEILSKTPDTRLRVNDVWMLTHLEGEEIQLQDEKQRPSLEIQVAENRIAGKGVCNRFFGSLKQLTDNQLSFKEGMGSTRMACPNMELEGTYFRKLSETKNYTLYKGTLIFSDADGREVLRFRKTD